MALRSVNPFTGREIETFETLSDRALEERLAAAATAADRLRSTSYADRAGWLARAADILESESGRLGEIMTSEMGKPIAQARGEAEKCAWVCRYYAEYGAGFLADEPAEAGARESFVRYEPLGPVLAIMPWNFPFWQVFRFGAPALMAGNPVLLKHAPSVPRCALAIEELLERAGVPEGVFQTLLIEEDRAGDVIDDPRVRAVTLTGSVAAGKAVASRAGENVKKTVLELGGSDPFIVLPDADLEAAVETGVRARCQNSGQSCIAAKRFLVHEAVFEEFRSWFVEAMEALIVGDPMDEETDVGPLASEEGFRALDRQVRETADAGARVLTGGAPLDREGHFYPPTALDRIPAGSPAAREELFGPVASLFPVKGVEDALELANGTGFGLGASVWTADADARDRLVSGLEAGVVFVNDMVASDPRLPFGGVKTSGYGRELARHGIREFVNVKTVSIGEG